MLFVRMGLLAGSKVYPVLVISVTVMVKVPGLLSFKRKLARPEVFVRRDWVWVVPSQLIFAVDWYWLPGCFPID